MRDSYPDDLTDSQEIDTEFAAFQQQVARVSHAPPAPPLPRMGQHIAGKYRIDGLLGCGGMGAVFSVTHQWTGRPFAVKWLLPNLAGHPDAVQRFKREARASGKIVHPNVIQVYDIGEDGQSHYIVMELVHGVTLAERLRQRGRFEVAEACRVLIPVLRGVHAAHLAGVVHRDLKPQNLMLAHSTHGHVTEEVPKVLDFGISKISPAADGAHSVSTRAGVVIGTPHYMSLEQLRSAAVDARSDIYALGVIAYHMLSGTLPFSGKNYADLVCQILGQTAVPLDDLVPGIPQGLANVVAKAMAVEPEERFQSVEAMARALEPFAGGLQFAPQVQGANDNVAIAPGVDDALPLAAAQDASTQDTQASLDGFDNQETSFAPLPLPLRAAGKEQLQEPRLLRLAAMRNAPRSTLLLASGAVVSIGLVVAVWLATSSYSVASTQPSDAPSVAAPNLVVPAAVRAAQSDTPTAPDGWEAASPAPSSTEPPAGKDEPTLSDDDYRPAPRQTSRRVVPAAPATRDAKARNNTALRIRRGDYR